MSEGTFFQLPARRSRDILKEIPYDQERGGRFPCGEIFYVFCSLQRGRSSMVGGCAGSSAIIGKGGSADGGSVVWRDGYTVSSSC